MSLPPFVVLLLIGGAGVQPAGDVRARDAWVAEPVAGRDAAAGYVTIQNDGPREARLIAVTTPAARAAEIHEIASVGDRKTMRQVSALAVPSRGTLELKPGGYHLMLVGLTRPLAIGDSVAIALRFSDGSTLSVTAPVRRREDR